MPQNLILVAPINKLSYGYVSQNILRAMTAKGIRVNLVPIGPLEPEQANAPLIQTCIENSKAGLPRETPALIIFHQNMLGQYKKFAGKHFGFPIFELDRLTPEDQNHMNAMDGLFVTSKYFKQVCEANDIKPPVGVANLGVEIPPSIVNTSYLNKDDFCETVNFVTAGKWEIRKGHDILLEVFKRYLASRQAGDKPFTLTLVCDNPFISKPDNLMWRYNFKRTLGTRVRFVSRLRTHEALLRTLHGCNLGIFLSRAEGWNMELSEMLAMGKQCIVANTTAHQEYCDARNCLLVEPDSRAVAADGSFFFGQSEWADFSDKAVDRIVECVRLVLNPKTSCGKPPQFVTNAVKNSMLKYTWERTAESLLAGMNLN